MHRKKSVSVLVLAIALFVSACARRPPERLIRPVRVDPVQALRTDVDAVLQDPAFENAFWGVIIESLDQGDTLYERNSGKLLMPASNMKLITAAASLKKLGSDFQYQTLVGSDGSIVEGALQGNLIVTGSGDPTISGRFSDGNAFEVFDQWAARLQQLGVRTIVGDVVGVDTFDTERIGYGWSWDDLPYYYATETAALQFAENSITITITAQQPGDPVLIQKEPETSYINVVADVQVQPETTEPQIDWSYDPASRIIYASGFLPPGGSDYGSFSVHDPAAYFVTVFKERLQLGGITVQGPARVVGAGQITNLAAAHTLISHHSPALREILAVLLKVSQNMYAETLLKTLGNGNFSAGTKEIENILIHLGISSQHFIIMDGSGLSRYNYVTPSGLLQLLLRMYRDPDFDIFFNALAIAGVDGTLRSRLKQSSAANNVHAKTGSLSNVRSLSGYAHTLDGEMLGFVMIANNFSVAPETIQAAQDAILQKLTAFSRAKHGTAKGER